MNKYQVQLEIEYEMVQSQTMNEENGTPITTYGILISQNTPNGNPICRQIDDITVDNKKIAYIMERLQQDTVTCPMLTDALARYLTEYPFYGSGNPCGGNT